MTIGGRKSLVVIRDGDWGSDVQRVKFDGNHVFRCAHVTRHAIYKGCCYYCYENFVVVTFRHDDEVGIAELLRHWGVSKEGDEYFFLLGSVDIVIYD